MTDNTLVVPNPVYEMKEALSGSEYTTKKTLVGMYFWIGRRFVLVTDTMLFLGPKNSICNYGQLKANKGNIKEVADFLKDPKVPPPTLIALIELVTSQIQCEGEIIRRFINNGGAAELFFKVDDRKIVLEADEPDLCTTYKEGGLPYKISTLSEGAKWLQERA